MPGFFVYLCRCFLLHDNLCSFAACHTDVDAMLRLCHAYTLEVEPYGLAILGSDTFDSDSVGHIDSLHIALKTGSVIVSEIA